MLKNTTFLEAINIVLSNSQLSPVESLESGDIDAETAESLLNETLIEVQAVGWAWNTETLKLVTDVDGYINLPENVLEVDPVDRFKNVVQRGSRLYDMENNTFIFEEGFDCIVVFALDYEQLPQAVRRYVALKASMIFQQRTLGDQVLDSYLNQEQMRAWYNLRKAQVKSTDGNHIYGGPVSGLMKSRIRPRNRRYRG